MKMPEILKQIRFNKQHLPLIVIFAVIATAILAFSFAAPKPPNSGPTLLNPSNSQTVNETPAFSWSSVSRARQYRIQISLNTDTNFSNNLIDSIVKTTSYTAASPFSANTYKWRVRAENSSPGPWSSPSTFTVSTTTAPPPPSACSGTAVSPGTDLRSLVSSNPEGTTFCLKSGAYSQKSSVLAKNNISIIGEAGTILDFTGAALDGTSPDKWCIYGYGGSTGQRNVTVKGLVVQNCAGYGIKAGWNWTVENNEVTASETGLQINNYGVFKSNKLHGNKRYGLNGGPTTEVLIENNEIANNNTARYDVGDAGGSKIVGSTPGSSNIVWRGNYAHDNYGHGLWADGNVTNSTYENNRVENNGLGGIFHEISWGAVIRNNVAKGNGTIHAGKSCWYQAGIILNNSQNVQIYGNTVEANGVNGICLTNANRSEASPFPTKLANVSVYDNTIYLRGAAYHGLVGDAVPTDIQFSNNKYYVDNTSASHWAHIQYPISWSTWRSKGNDSTGTLEIWQ